MKCIDCLPVSFNSDAVCRAYLTLTIRTVEPLWSKLPLGVAKVNNNQHSIACECNKESNSVLEGKKMAEK